MLKTILIILVIFLLLEVVIYVLFSLLKKDFQWLIGKEDINPKFSKHKLNNFIKKSYDKLLGWDRKASTKGFEVSNKKTYFKINKLGARGRKIYKDDKFYVFGDSFAFCRYVNDNETWQFYFSKRNKKNVLNFGVGNYGLDQAFLKYLKISKKLPKKKVIFCVVPETIARVFSYWKHFREFNNIFAIKPIINFKNKNLNIVKIPKLNTKKISNEFLKFDEKFLIKVKKKDIFYNLKFKKNIFKFPFFVCFLKNFNLNMKIFYYLLLNKLLKKNNYKYRNFAYTKILENNIKESHSYYENPFFKKKFSELIDYIDVHFKKREIEYSILIVPQYHDLKSHNTRSKYIKYYKDLNNPNVIDLTKSILEIKNWSKYYFVDKYGGHLNKSGNKFLSNIIYKKLL